MTTPVTHDLTLGPTVLPYGTKWEYSSESGEVVAVRNARDALVVSGIQRLPFGPVTFATLNVTPQVSQQLSYDLHYELTERKAVDSVGATTALSFAYVRDPAGRIRSRTASGASLSYSVNNRFFRYDRAGRIECDTTSDAGTGPCPLGQLTNSVLRGAYTYKTDGTTSPDSRAQVTQVWPSENTFDQRMSYVAGTNKILEMLVTDVFGQSATGGYLYDGRGRVIRETDSRYPRGEADRSFYYLPNGRLGSIGLQHAFQSCPGGNGTCVKEYVPVILSFGYDHRGRLFSATFDRRQGTYAAAIRRQWQFYWDEADRLTAFEFTPATGDQTTYQRYSFMHLDGERVAAVREAISSCCVSTTKMFFMNDQHGTPYQVINDAKTVMAEAEVEPFGMRKFYVLQPYFQFPEILLGSIWFNESTVTPFRLGCNLADGSQCNLHFVRHGLSIHGQRTYDPHTGRFLEPDVVEPPATFSRNYSYAENAPATFVDPSGMWPIRNCWKGDTREIHQAFVLAIWSIWTCPPGTCDGISKSVWLWRLITLTVECNQDDFELTWVDGPIPYRDDVLIPAKSCATIVPGTSKTTFYRSAFRRMCDECLAETLLHESIHSLGIDSENGFGSAGCTAIRCSPCPARGLRQFKCPPEEF